MGGQDNDPLLSIPLVQGPVSNPPKPWYDETHYFFFSTMGPVISYSFVH